MAMNDIAVILAGELIEADQLSRIAESRKVMLLAELASNYDIHMDDVVEVLAQRKVTVGIGAPTVPEYLCLEVAGLLGCTPTAASGKIADAVNLKHRHPTLYQAMQDLQIEAARACRAAEKCVDLPPEVAEQVTTTWLQSQHRFGWTAAFNRLAKEIIGVDPEAAARKERRARGQLGVNIWGHYNGTMNLTGRLENLDARYLDAAVARMAEILRSHQPMLSGDALRAKALGVLANPAYALALLQQAAQPTLPDDAPAAETSPEDDVPGDGQRHDPHGCRGHQCGTITTPLHKLRPRLGIAVHLHVDAVGNLEGAARVERAGHVALETLSEALAGIDVTLHPVIDIPNLPPEDRYVPSASLRTALELAMPAEMFPFSNRTHIGMNLDLDHTVPYTGGRRGQTRLGNLAPLSRRTHRSKTAGLWKVEQPRSLVLVWVSPLGLRYEVHPQEGTRRVVEDPPPGDPPSTDP